MKKILLINPNIFSTIMPNMGLMMLDAYIKQHHHTEILDYTFDPNNYIKMTDQKMKVFNPDIVGISVNSYSLKAALTAAKHIKQIAPSVKIILGGVFSTLEPKKAIAHDIIDAICIGDGEESFIEYIEHYQNPKRLEDVPGIWFRKEDKSIYQNVPRPFFQDLDSVPFINWSDWNLESYLHNGICYLPRSIHLLGSRGCPHGCTYCSNHVLAKCAPGKWFRSRTPQNIIDEISYNLELYRKNNVKAIYFCDEIFHLSRKNLKLFCQLYIKNGFAQEFPWCCKIRADQVDSEWAELVKTAGCRLILTGVESGNQHMREHVFKKKISRETIINAFNTLKEKQIGSIATFIYGAPGDNYKTIKESITLAKIIKPLATFWLIYQPLPRTKLAEGVTWTYDDNARRKHMEISLYIMLWRLSFFNLFNFIINGTKMKGIIFWIDIAKYLISFRDRDLPLFHKNNMSHIQRKTIFKYLIDHYHIKNS